MILKIDTTDNLKTRVQLGSKVIERKYNQPREQELLVLIDQILKDNKASLKQITAIKVNPGPGSFTGTRVGVAVANALAWSLGIKVNGKNRVVPIYK
jgi:tRNA threonylcarbamoyladenosine biosynthesis protein TsaB